MAASGTSPIHSSTRRSARAGQRRLRPIAAASTLAVAVTIALAPPAAAETSTPIASASAHGVALELDRVIGTPEWAFGPDEWRYYRLQAQLTGEEEVTLGLSVDLLEEGVLEELWRSPTLLALLGDGAILRSFFSTSVTSGGIDTPIPDWPGLTYVFSVLDPETLDPIGEVLRVTNEGLHVPFLDYSRPGYGINLASLSGPDLFPGMTATVTAANMPPGRELGVWMAPGLDYVSFMLAGAQLPPAAIEAGRAVVGADGHYSATFTLPPSTPTGHYQLVVGDPATRAWPAGTEQAFLVSAAATQQSVPTPTGAGVQTALGLPTSTITVTYDTVSTAGDTTAIVSSTGPLLSGFQFALTPPEYVHLSTTATTSGPREVCLTYDPARAATPPRLYHFDVDRWVDVTTVREVGRVCGVTTSFSPFVLGYSTGVELANKQQCKNDGWRTSTLPRFVNQGDCVSWFEARRW